MSPNTEGSCDVAMLGKQTGAQVPKSQVRRETCGFHGNLVDRLIEKGVADGLLDEEDELTARYALIWGYHTIGCLIGILVIGGVSGVWKTALTAAGASGSLRFVSGGAHFRCSRLSFVFSTAAFILVAYLGRLAMLLPQAFIGSVMAVCVASGLTSGLVIISLYVPDDTAHRPLTSHEAVRFRLLSFTLVFMITILFTILVFYVEKLDYAFSIWFAYCLQLFSLTPVGMNVFDKVEKMNVFERASLIK